MPSVPPTSANDYQAPPAPDRFVVDRAVWNGVFGSIGERLRTLEDVNSGIEQIKLELQNFGLQRLDEAINPLIEETQANLALLQQAVADAQQELEDTVDSANAAFAAALAAANASLVDLQTQLDQMLGGGVPAVNVAVAEIDGLEAVTAQAAFAELLDNIETAVTTLTTAIGSKAEAAALAALKAGTATIVTASVTAVAGDRIFVKTAGGTLTVTLPAAPVDGNRIVLWRYGASTLVVARNGKTIAGAADNLNINTDKVEVTFIYLDGDWRVFARPFA